MKLLSNELPLKRSENLLQSMTIYRQNKRLPVDERMTPESLQRRFYERAPCGACPQK